jgi:alanyl-tRNA synthetase
MTQPTPKTSAQLRQAFLDFFAHHQHAVVNSSPLVPDNDPTLLFTNAGMVQFKDVFLGLDTRAYSCATSCQRCVRAGGKHNDLENVGYTARHHTFFEMLGNFSFGDYFKREAIQLAWQFLTDVLRLPPEKLWITVYEQDSEAANIWLNELKISPQRFSYCGEKDNFWSMGDTGPCGPCSEIFYDHGAEVAGGPPNSPDADGDRYVEIWNLVFMQFNRDAAGKLTPLPKPSVDTGMGLERLAAVMQGVHSNYAIDLFQALIQATAKATDTRDLNHASLRVIADHIRAAAFLVVDGVIPANEGRGYVLRRIVRRALRHGHQLGVKQPFFADLVKALDEQMGSAYPELRDNQAMVKQVLLQEEKRFAETLEHGMVLLQQAMTELDGSQISGDVLFKLYDTYGFPVDLTADIAREQGLSVDLAGFDQAMQQQRKRARAASQFTAAWDNGTQAMAYRSQFIGYDHLSGETQILVLFYQGHAVAQLNQGQHGQIILEQTPFYAESGGQMGDQGQIQQGDALFVIEDTQKAGDAVIHSGRVVRGIINDSEAVMTQVDGDSRQATARNHSATHLLHAALRQHLGKHVKQKGSQVSAQRLRFDFSHFEPIKYEPLQAIEREINQQILACTAVKTILMPLEQAKASGAMALFGEKYAHDVRVLTMGNDSVELCGGTHVKNIGEIGLCKIISETGVAAGVRRIEAITGKAALAWLNQNEQQLNNLADLFKTERQNLTSKAEQLLRQIRDHEKELHRLQSKLAASQGDDLAMQAIDIQGIKVLAVQLDGADNKRLRDTLDRMKNKLKSAAIVLAAVDGDKISLVAGVTSAETEKIKAGALVNHVAQQVGGKGGGRPDMAQAGGNQPAHLAAALASVKTWVAAQF